MPSSAVSPDVTSPATAGATSSRTTLPRIRAGVTSTRPATAEPTTTTRAEVTTTTTTEPVEPTTTATAPPPARRHPPANSAAVDTAPAVARACPGRRAASGS
jgi:hypothetical protein